MLQLSRRLSFVFGILTMVLILSLWKIEPEDHIEVMLTVLGIFILGLLQVIYSYKTFSWMKMNVKEDFGIDNTLDADLTRIQCQPFKKPLYAQITGVILVLYSLLAFFSLLWAYSYGDLLRALYRPNDPPMFYVSIGLLIILLLSPFTVYYNLKMLSTNFVLENLEE